MDDFLKTEYEQCLSLIKYYDERHQSLVKYASGMSGAIPSLLLAIFQLGNGAGQYFWPFTLLISIVTTFGLISIFTVLIQTRLYFIYPVRQVNSIRRYSLEKLRDNMFENQMYLNTTFNAFKWTSSHTLLNFFVAMQTGAFAGLATYSALLMNQSNQCIISLSILFGLLFSLVLFGASSFYLYKSSQYHPDKSVHKEG
jgi:hypothetical protein